MHEPTYHGLHKWTHHTVEKFAWIMMFGDDLDKQHYYHNIKKLYEDLRYARSVYTEADRVHDIEVLMNTVISLKKLIKGCHVEM